MLSLRGSSPPVGTLDSAMQRESKAVTLQATRAMTSPTVSRA